MKKRLLVIPLILNILLTTSALAQQGPRPNNPGQPDRPGQPDQPDRPDQPGNNDERLQALISQLELTPAFDAVANLPDIADAKPQLGKQLFFTKNLGGEQSAACVSCHHPSLGGADQLSLPVGVNAVDALNIPSHDLLGQARFNGSANVNNLPTVPRNSPSVFNLGLLTRGLFWDSRVETNRRGNIMTPDSPLNEQGQRLPDSNLAPGTSLAAAQARFPVTSGDEMRGQFMSDADNQTLRAALAKRLDDSDESLHTNWPVAFELAFGDREVNFQRISEALGEYERSMVFVNNPWNNYLNGDTQALSEQQKAGALLFFGARQQGGANCVACHSGPTFSDQRQHLVAFPQMGPGKGNASETATSSDFGRENVSADAADRYHFRTPSLLNIAQTAPYGHSGAFQTLQQVVAHYSNPRRSIERLFAAQGQQPFVDGLAPFCQLDQIVDLMQKNNQTCESLYPDAYANSTAVVEHLQQAQNNELDARAPLRRNINLSREQTTQLVAFLNALTDPCIQDRDCLAPWIVDQNDVASFPDDKALVAHDSQGNLL